MVAMLFMRVSIPLFIKPIIIDGDVHIDGSIINDFIRIYKNIDENYSNIQHFNQLIKIKKIN